MKLHQVALFGFSRLASWTAVRNDSDSSTTETSEDRRTQRRSTRSREDGAASRCLRRARTAPPSVNSTSDDDERPEVALASVAERVLRGRGPLARGRRRGTAGAWLPVSAREWIASASSDAEPVIAKPTNFEMAMPRLARNAAMIAWRLPSCIGSHWHNAMHVWSSRRPCRTRHRGRARHRRRHLSRSRRGGRDDRGELPTRCRCREGDRRRDRVDGRLRSCLRSRRRRLRGGCGDGRVRGHRLRLRRHPRAQRRHRVARQVGGRHRRRRSSSALVRVHAFERTPAGAPRVAVDAHAARAATS